MSRLAKYVFFIGFFFCATAFSVHHFWRGDTISADQAEKRWGAVHFDQKKFKTGDFALKASMAASIKRRENEFKNKTILEIRELLGPTDGFYFADIYPTYLLQVGKNHQEETWQLVFMINNKRRIESVIIHKNCCD